MNNAGILLGGVLALAAVMAITAAIMAVAPYIAILAVAVFIYWWVMRESPTIKEEPPNLSQGTATQVTQTAKATRNTSATPVSPPEST
jgi:predicted lipid-binding transport protein (Tim44 family)